MLFINAIFRHSITEYSFLLLIKVLTIEHFNLYLDVLPFLSPLPYCCTWVPLILVSSLYTLPRHGMRHLGRIDEPSISCDQDILYGKKNSLPNQARRRWWWRGRWEGWKQNRNMKVEVYNVFQVDVNGRTITNIWCTNSSLPFVIWYDVLKTQLVLRLCSSSMISFSFMFFTLLYDLW